MKNLKILGVAALSLTLLLSACGKNDAKTEESLKIGICLRSLFRVISFKIDPNPSDLPRSKFVSGNDLAAEAVRRRGPAGGCSCDFRPDSPVSNQFWLARHSRSR